MVVVVTGIFMGDALWLFGREYIYAGGMESLEW